MTEPAAAERDSYRDWKSIEQAIKDAARSAARNAGPGVGAATVDARIRQARFDRFLSLVFSAGEKSEWLLKGGMSMLARVSRSRTTKDVDLASQHTADLAEAQRALADLVDTELGDHLTFRLIRSRPTGLGENQPGLVACCAYYLRFATPRHAPRGVLLGRDTTRYPSLVGLAMHAPGRRQTASNRRNRPLATRRLIFACIDVDHDIQIDTVTVDVAVGPPPVGRPEVVEPANRLYLRRPLIVHRYRLYPVADQIADKVCATMASNYPGGKRSSRVEDLVDLVVLAHTQAVDLHELRAAITHKRSLSNIEPFTEVDIPVDWTRTYRDTPRVSREPRP